MIRTWICAFALAAVAVTPGAAPAQCGMGGMMGSGHDHARHEGSGRATKHDKTIQKLLADEDARARLYEVIALDDALFREFLERAFESGHGRRIGEEQLKQARHGAEPGAGRGAPPPDSTLAGPVYRCPMHPDVVSSVGGTCGECGMKLERIDGPAEP